MTLPGADLIGVACGLVRRVVEYSDTAGFAEQLAGIALSGAEPRASPQPRTPAAAMSVAVSQ